MPYNWKDEYIESRADKHTNIISFGEIGGIGQLIYHNFRFAHYMIDTDENDRLMAIPICDKNNPPDLTPRDGLTGSDILTSLCNLAQQIDDIDEAKPYYELIALWCKENMHPYAVDELYEELNDSDFVLDGFDAEIAVRDGVFYLDDFMTELGRLYYTARFYMAFEGICLAEDELALGLWKEGKHFEGPAVFERYKYMIEETPLDRTATKEGLLEEMQQNRQCIIEEINNTKESGYFASEPFDDYERLRSELVNCIPDFKLRLKVDPRTNRMVFSADVYSVFDIAWYTLARMITDDPAPEDATPKRGLPEGIIMCCRHCGRFFVRNARHQQYCKRVECQKSRNAKNQQQLRRRRAMEKAHKQK